MAPSSKRSARPCQWGSRALTHWAMRLVGTARAGPPTHREPRQAMDERGRKPPTPIVPALRLRSPRGGDVFTERSRANMKDIRIGRYGHCPARGIRAPARQSPRHYRPVLVRRPGYQRNDVEQASQRLADQACDSRSRIGETSPLASQLRRTTSARSGHVPRPSSMNLAKPLRSKAGQLAYRLGQTSSFRRRANGSKWRDLDRDLIV